MEHISRYIKSMDINVIECVETDSRGKRSHVLDLEGLSWVEARRQLSIAGFKSVCGSSTTTADGKYIYFYFENDHSINREIKLLATALPLAVKSHL